MGPLLEEVTSHSHSHSHTLSLTHTLSHNHSHPHSLIASHKRPLDMSASWPSAKLEKLAELIHAASSASKTKTCHPSSSARLLLLFKTFIRFGHQAPSVGYRLWDAPCHHHAVRSRLFGCPLAAATRSQHAACPKTGTRLPALHPLSHFLWPFAVQRYVCPHRRPHRLACAR